MAEKKLTKVQKEILQTLRDNPKAKIVSIWRGGYRLVAGETKRAIQFDTFQFLRPWLIQGPYSRGQSDYYTFKKGAEITDSWRSDELARQGLERLNRQAEAARQKLLEEQQAEARLREVWEVLTSGNVEKEVEIYPHAIFFKHNGRRYRIEDAGEVSNE